MARHSNIRIRMGKMFSTCTIIEIVQFLNKLVSVIEETEDNVFVFHKNQYTINRISDTLFMLDKHPQVFILADVINALKDFSVLSETIPNKRYIDIFFTPGTYPSLPYLTEERCGLINAKLFAMVLGRAHNCYRKGMDSPIYIDQVIRKELVRTFSISNIKFQEKELIVKMEISQAGVIIHTGEYTIPIRRSIFQKENWLSQIVVKPRPMPVLEEEEKKFTPFIKIKELISTFFM